MYEKYYRFTGRPFQLTPDPAFYFESATHRKAMSYLGYGLAQGEGFIVITGDIGAGKTTLVGHLMATIDPQRLTAVKIVSTQVDGDDMLRLAAQAFGIATDHVEKAHVLSRIEAFLHHQARAGRRTLLVVDEAQNLSPTALEELRMLSNFQLGGQSLLQIFLLGQPEFRERISGSEGLEQLRQRIIATHHLDPMQPEEVGPYIEHRLKVVGWTGNPRFTSDAHSLLAQASGCVPRRLNALVSRVLLLGAIDQLDIIDERVVEAVVADLGNDFAAPDSETPPATQAARAALMAEAEDGSEAGDVDHLRELQSEVETLNAAIARGERHRDPAMPPQETRLPEAAEERIAELEARLASAEQRLDEQDEVLRRILSKLIEWVERDARNGPFTSRVA
ncbi:XrtA/PEP-CTERM system-associated ATPase [Sphingobium lignivorans]|uniref:Secretion ATPase (PEP-CTERM system associated) n=1 Tax=Sphingobium lignivorans TaxID=2735886 RepID=A0ABR6NGP5_9SPHN|nr:XrtA/PEP-CTERM system-associated ATPase [Sphingobium lignivorans]MBB5986458.1 putative secretion ATPase (PEP-CTERM system associated) [Sphingobium lignivorans]